MSALHVIDLGLDFKSFANYTDANGRPEIGNQFHFPVEEIADKFMPTCGLLTAVLHGYAATASTSKGQVWLDQYRRLQAKLFDETKSVEAGNVLSFLAQYPNPLVAPLFDMLDRQMNMTGNNAPSQRRINVDTKHALCNLHINERAGCHQGAHCNQLHLVAEAAAHRHEFYSHIVEVMKEKGECNADMIRHRIVDAMFFARYGNRVTVEVGGHHYQFFKTQYTDGRLAHALGIDTTARVVVPPGTSPHKPQRLPAGDAHQILKELSNAASLLIDEHASPTTRKWNAVMSTFGKQAGLGTGASHHAQDPHQAFAIAPELAKHLAAVNMETSMPSTEDGITPLIESVHRSRFDAL